MKKTLIIMFSLLFLFQLSFPAFSVPSVSTQLSAYDLSIKDLPENIKHLVNNYDDLSAADYSMPIGETLYDLAIPTADGKTEISVYSVPIKFENDDGTLEFIDTSFTDLNIAKKIISGYNYKNAANTFSVLFSDKPQKGFKMDNAFTMSIPAENTDTQTTKIDKDENNDGRLTYNNIYGEGTYIEYININSGVKENIILEKNIGKNRFDFEWSSDTHYLELSDDSTFINVISIETEKTDYVFSPLYAYDSYTIKKEQSTYTAETDSTYANSEYTIGTSTDTPTVSETLAEEDDVLEQQVINSPTDNYEKQYEIRQSTSNYVNKHNTDDCYYEITDNGNGNYTITAVVSKEFLDSKETVYPVVIDPSVTASSSTSNIDDTYVNQASPDTNYGSWTYMCFGYNSGKRWGYIKFKTLPTEITCGSQIASAELTLKFRTGQTTSYTGKIGGIKTKNWSEDTLTWNTRISWSGYNTTSDHYNCSYYKFDLTKLVQDWYNGDCPNYGVVFTYTDQTHNDYNSVYSSESSAVNAPSLRIIYSRVEKTIYYNNDNPQSNINSSYDREDAKQYAIDYAEYESSDINDTPNYRSTKYSKGGILGDGDGNNCTNFVSQCLHEGNMAYIGDESTRELMSSWFYDTKLSFYYASYTWGGATSFAKHWGHTPSGVGHQRAYMTIVYEDFWDVIYDWDYLIDTLKKGDVIQFSYNNVDLGHSVIITEVDSTNKTITYAQHTENLDDINFNDRIIELMEDGLMYSVVIHKIKK